MPSKRRPVDPFFNPMRMPKRVGLESLVPERPLCKWIPEYFPKTALSWVQRNLPPRVPGIPRDFDGGDWTVEPTDSVSINDRDVDDIIPAPTLEETLLALGGCEGLGELSLSITSDVTMNVTPCKQSDGFGYYEFKTGKMKGFSLSDETFADLALRVWFDHKNIKWRTKE